MTRSLCCFLSLLFILGCSSTPKPKTLKISADAQAGKSSVLTRETAMFRSRQIHKIAYQLWFGFTEKAEGFSGRTKILFEVRENGFKKSKSLRLDFTGGTITSLSVNGKAWDAEKTKDHYNGERLEIPRGELPLGKNQIEIAYFHPYSESGNGLYRFKDPEDGRIYLRSDLEPYYANLIFPCFDQPDLKASFEMTVEAPSDWTVLGNMPTREPKKIEDRLSWRFAPSPLMSSYLFALAAGPWKEWKSELDGLPLGLYSRQSLSKFVDSPEWFHTTKKGLEFFADFFGYPYPYPKYDQILIPDMNAGAMENIGLITFSERAIFRGPSTEEERRHRADTILHEMAHQWFGDLVTMRWWNGLWLNESFATYMASVALERTNLFPGAPQAFFSGMKRWAYSEDQLPTTHPIDGSVPDTDQASANFDGITYGKGAAALKQLHSLLGDEDFQEGLHRYFTRFANRNTSLADFMTVMGETSDRSLTNWTQTWLKTTGYNTITVDLACEPDEKGHTKISKLDLVQTAPGNGNTLRPHQLGIGLYYRDGAGRLEKEKLEKELSVAFEGERVSIDEVVGKKCPDLVFPNEADHGYGVVNLDPKSLETAKTSLARISNPFTRHLLVFTLWEMVKAVRWKVGDFATASLGWITIETNKTLLDDLGEMLVSSRNGRNSVAKLLNDESRPKFLADLQKIARRKIETSGPGSDLQRIWFKIFLRTLSQADAEFALKLVAKKAKISGLKVDVDLRWEILLAVARIQPIDPKILEEVAKDDPSASGQASLLKVKAASSNLADDFPALFTLEKTDPRIPITLLKKSTSTYLNASNPGRIREWRPKFFAALESVAAKTDDSYYRDFSTNLYPALCLDEVGDETTAWLNTHPDVPTAMRVALSKMAFSEKWCAAIRAGREYPLWTTSRNK